MIDAKVAPRVQDDLVVFLGMFKLVSGVLPPMDRAFSLCVQIRTLRCHLAGRENHTVGFCPKIFVSLLGGLTSPFILLDWSLGYDDAHCSQSLKIVPLIGGTIFP